MKFFWQCIPLDLFWSLGQVSCLLSIPEEGRKSALLECPGLIQRLPGILPSPVFPNTSWRSWAYSCQLSLLWPLSSLLQGEQSCPQLESGGANCIEWSSWIGRRHSLSGALVSPSQFYTSVWFGGKCFYFCYCFLIWRGWLFDIAI